jgi:predicted kinase
VPVHVSGCLFVTGMPGSGKTTVTKRVAARLDRAARISGDDLHQILVSGRVRFDSGQRDEAARQGELRAHNLCTLVDNFAAADFTVVIDEVVPDREHLDYYLEHIAARPVYLVVLAPALEVCQRRNAARPAPDRVDYDFSQYDAALRPELAAVGWWLDTAHQTPEETADLILSQVTLRGLVSP